MEYADELSRESEEQISAATDLLEDIFDQKVNDTKFKNVTPIIIEILWSNFSILKMLDEELDDPTFHLNEKTQEEEYIFLEEAIFGLQSLLLTRFYANLELNKLSYSVSLH
tara:strand:+ start:901 stop:1233 length:333 start_codon:yes stop_codon:yes gene_type:complete